MVGASKFLNEMQARSPGDYSWGRGVEGLRLEKVRHCPGEKKNGQS